jgi:iron complex outermembrane receptor protein
MRIFIGLLFCSTALLTNGADAQTMTSPTGGNGAATSAATLEEIIVTAQRREQNLQDVPLAVTAFSGQALNRANIENLRDLARLVPSLQVGNHVASVSRPILSIRGQRQSDPRIVTDPSVVLYVAEVPIQRPYGSGISAFMDVESVQVLNGPQGTLFGRNTTGGAILVKPQEPTGEFSAEMTVGVGNYDLRQGTAIVNLPVTDSIAARVAFTGADRNGVYHNYGVGPDQVSLNYYAIRGSVSFKPTDRLSSTFIYDYFKNDSTGGAGMVHDLRPGGLASLYPLGQGGGVAAYMAARSKRPFYSTDTDIATFDRGYATGGTNITVWKASDAFTFKNIAAYRKTDNRQFTDADGTPFPLIHVSFRDDIEQYSEEAQLRYSANRLDVIGGVFFFREEGISEQDPGIYLGGLSPPVHYVADAKNTSKSVYAQANWQLTNQLEVIAGGRWTWDERRLDARNRTFNAPVTCLQRDPAGVPLAVCSVIVNAKFDAPSWNLTANYELSERQRVYLAHRRGYRSGGFNLTPLQPLQFIPFRPEKVDDIEVGYKGDFSFDSGAALRLNAATYYSWYRDIQRSINRQIVSATGVSSLATSTVNAAKAHIWGAELSAIFAPNNALSFSAVYAYNKAKFLEFVAQDQNGNPVDLSYSDIADLPEHKGSLTVRYELPVADSVGQISIQGTAAYRSSAQIDDLPEPGGRQKGYALYDARLTWDRFLKSNLSLAIWGKNLSNTHYYTTGSSLYSGPFGVNFRYMGVPRTYGAELTARF